MNWMRTIFGESGAHEDLISRLLLIGMTFPQLLGHPLSESCTYQLRSDGIGRLLLIAKVGGAVPDDKSAASV